MRHRRTVHQIHSAMCHCSRYNTPGSRAIWLAGLSGIRWRDESSEPSHAFDYFRSALFAPNSQIHRCYCHQGFVRPAGATAHHQCCLRPGRYSQACRKTPRRLFGRGNKHRSDTFIDQHQGDTQNRRKPDKIFAQAYRPGQRLKVQGGAFFSIPTKSHVQTRLSKRLCLRRNHQTFCILSSARQMG